MNLSVDDLDEALAQRADLRLTAEASEAEAPEVATVFPAAAIETPAPVTVQRRHPAAGSEPPFPLADPGEYYIGLWAGKPNYGCPYCSYATLAGPGAVELHILARIDQGHPKHLKALELR